MANGTERPLVIVETYADRDIDGGRLEPGEEYFFDDPHWHAGPIEIRDERGVLLTTIATLGACPDDAFLVTEEFLEVESYVRVSNCLDPPAIPGMDVVDATPMVEDPEGLILQARWRDPEARSGLPYASVGETGAALLDGSEPTVLKIAVNGTGCVPEATVVVERHTPSLALNIELGPAIETTWCRPVGVRAHTIEVVLAQPVALDSLSVVATDLTLVEDG